jgi:hypothetical protein
MKRSDKTEIRHLRMTLRNARAALRHLLERAPLNEDDERLARMVVEHINARLAPKRPSSSPGSGR